MIYDENNPEQQYESQEEDYLEQMEVHLTTEPIGDLRYTPTAEMLTISEEYDD